MHWLGLLGMMAFGADSDHFESKVRPVFAARCQQCHGPKLQSGGLNLTTGEGLNATKLITALSHGGSIKMPPSGKLADADLAAIRDWVAGGGQVANRRRSRAKQALGV